VSQSQDACSPWNNTIQTEYSWNPRILNHSSTYLPISSHDKVCSIYLRLIKKNMDYSLSPVNPSFLSIKLSPLTSVIVWNYLNLQWIFHRLFSFNRNNHNSSIVLRALILKTALHYSFLLHLWDILSSSWAAKRVCQISTEACSV